jgi:cell division protein FtsI (penicillin-binding protein 3)
LIFIFIVARVILLQGFNTDCFYVNENSCKKNLSNVADKRQIDLKVIKTFRGIIYDRNNEMLAMSIPRKTLCINISRINYDDKDINYKKLLKLIKLPEKKFKKILKKHKNKKEYYLKRKIRDDLAKDISKLDLPNIYFIDEYQRVYLGGSYFSNIIGFTDIDNNGQSGIEYSKNTELSSISGIKKIRKDNLGRSIELIDFIKKPSPGEDVYLSIDKRIQFIGFNILREYTEKFDADSSSLVLVKVKTGEIIAMANYPSFNPSNRKELFGPKIKNSVTSISFEPGSTIKPFTVYNTLIHNTFKEKDSISTSPGMMKIGKHEINDYKDLGDLSLEDIIRLSSNVGAAKISLANNKKNIHTTLEKFDFGKSLYFDFHGEEQGSLPHYSSWDDARHASIGYGYGLSTTLLHLANAYTILANHGKKIQLTYERINNRDIFYEDVLDEEVSKKIVNMMQSVVENGTAKKARLEKYTVAGKTGTVRIIKDGEYKKNSHLAIFVGITPVTNPEYVAAVVVRNPKNGPASGGKNAAPIFRDFMSHSLNLLKVYPDRR